MKTQKLIGYPFVSHVNQENKPTIENVGEFIKKVYNNPIWYVDFLNNGIYKNGGYIYDFKPFLKRYLYRQYGNWNVLYAPNKTSARKCIYGKINQITEIPKH